MQDQHIPQFEEKAFLFLQEIIADIPRNTRVLEERKNAFAAKHGISTLKNRDLVVVAQKNNLVLPEKISKLIQKRSVRTISGVSPIGILTKPYDCPGKCIYCPTEDRMPKSYMSNQPAAARAKRNHFHPFLQVKNRIVSLEESGHPTSKLEVIVMGGTWSFLPTEYQQWYIKKVFEAANSFEEQNSKFKIQNLDTVEARFIAPKKQEEETATLDEVFAEQKINETAEHRVIGLTLETRPDWITEKELIKMRNYGCTRIEIGVQTLDDEVQKLTQRGHNRNHVIKAMKLMKDFGFKVCFHLMPGLPGSTPEKDIAWIKEVFENENFRPDFIKIYPCVVLETAELKTWWEEGKYEPYDDATLIKLLVQLQTVVPEYCRIMRLMRDIPVQNILGGAKFSNLRQILHGQPEKLKEIVGEEFFLEQELDKKPVVFRDIRAREIGFADEFKIQNLKFKILEPILKRRDYTASEGEEVFLSFESPDEEKLYALLRLRKPSYYCRDKKNNQGVINHAPTTAFPNALQNAALIREVHSYGTEVSVGENAEKTTGQHKGFGKKLLEAAEKIAFEEWGMEKISIIAGVGTREYYRKFGYEECETYMTKKRS